MQRTIASLPEGKKKLANGGKASKIKLRDEVFSGSRELLSCAVQEEEVREMTGSRANFLTGRLGPSASRCIHLYACAFCDRVQLICGILGQSDARLVQFPW